MAHGLVEQNAGPARTEHDGHDACRCGCGAEIVDCLRDGVASPLTDALPREELKPRACAASGRGSLAPAVFRGDDRDRKVDHGADVARKQAVKAAEERCIRLALKGDDHVCDPGIRLARQGVGLADELKRLWRVHVRGCVLRPAAGPVGAGGEAGGDDDAWGALGGVGGRGDHGACSIEKRDGREHVRVGERGGLAADGAQSCAPVDGESARLDGALVENPGTGDGLLKVDVRPVRACRRHAAEHLEKRAVVESRARVKKRLSG